VSGLSRAAAAFVGLALTSGLVAGSQLPWLVYPADAARIRLSWRTVSEPLSECRPATSAELEALPPHMRMREICERRHAPFRLQVRIDDAVARDVLLEPAGASGDRPLYVFEELPAAPGAHRLVVEFSEQRSSANQSALPARSFRLDVGIDLAAREVALVSFDASGERLAVVGSAR
jgi:hypothetical protein